MLFFTVFLIFDLEKGKFNTIFWGRDSGHINHWTLQFNQNEGEPFCNPPICQARSWRQSLQTPHSRGKQRESTHHNQSPWEIATAHNPSFWAGAVGAHLKCCCMPVVPEWSRSIEARSICKHFEGCFKCGLVFVLFCLFVFLYYAIWICCHTIAIALFWRLFMYACIFWWTGKCYWSANTKLQPLLCCAIHVSCDSL